MHVQIVCSTPYKVRTPMLRSLLKLLVPSFNRVFSVISWRPTETETSHQRDGNTLPERLTLPMPTLRWR